MHAARVLSVLKRRVTTAGATEYVNRVATRGNAHQAPLRVILAGDMNFRKNDKSRRERSQWDHPITTRW